MNETNTPVREDGTGIQLPYVLTCGVTATYEGLVLREWMLVALQQDVPIRCHELKTNVDIRTNARFWLVPWKDAAERLCYHPGEPWCSIYWGRIACFTIDDDWYEHSGRWNLHRTAALLCSNSESFHVLDWCIHNLPEGKE